MAAAADRLKGSLAAVARRADPMLLYRVMYRATLLVQSGDLQSVDVQPDDPLLPPMSGIPLRGNPGVTIRIAPRATLMIAFEDGRPDRPFAFAWAAPSSSGGGNSGGSPIMEMTIAVGTPGLLNLGGPNLVPLVDSVLRGATMCPILQVPHSAFGEASLVVLAKKGP